MLFLDEADIARLKAEVLGCEKRADLAVFAYRECAAFYPDNLTDKRNLNEAQTRLNILREAIDILAHLDWWDSSDDDTQPTV